jgi:hypothetical protein
VRRLCIILAAAVALTGCGAEQTQGPSATKVRPVGHGKCDIAVTPATFSYEVAGARSGQTVCLLSGNYGTWHGTSAAITVTVARGSSATMRIAFGAGAGRFTLTHVRGLAGTITSGAADITIRNATFAGPLGIQGAVTGIVVTHDKFTYPVRSVAKGANAKIFLDTSGARPGSAVTIAHNDIENGDLDGVHIGGGSGMAIVRNYFANLCDRNVNHTDNIQLESGTQIRIAGNYLHEPRTCPTQGITSYDGGTRGLVIEDNVVDIPRDWGIELYSDQASIVRHNTLVWHPRTYSEFHSGTGWIAIDRKAQDPAGAGTQVYDNITTGVSFADGSAGADWDNVSGAGARYTGPLTSWPGYRLSIRSPVGIQRGSRAAEYGARIPAPR